MSTPKYAPVATMLPLMHGSTSPSKNRLSAHGVSKSGSRQVTCSRTRPTARRACSLSGSSPNRRRSSRTWNVSVQSCDHGRPPHRPSGAWSASSRAPQPSVAILDRSAAMTSAGSCVRSRITCQRIAGSESSSQSMTVMSLPRSRARRPSAIRDPADEADSIARRGRWKAVPARAAGTRMRRSSRASPPRGRLRQHRPPRLLRGTRSAQLRPRWAAGVPRRHVPAPGARPDPR